MKTAQLPKIPRAKRGSRRTQSDDARFRASLGLAAWLAAYGKRAC